MSGWSAKTSASVAGTPLTIHYMSTAHYLCWCICARCILPRKAHSFRHCSCNRCTLHTGKMGARDAGTVNNPVTDSGQSFVTVSLGNVYSVTWSMVKLLTT